MADSSYGNLEISQWRVKLRRRLSPRLRNALVMAPDIPADYHDFVAYLRVKDAGFYEVNASSNYSAPLKPTTATPAPPRMLTNPFPPAPQARELTISQGGPAMDLDTISRQRGLDGRLTLQAKNARRALGRCLWCNRIGHLATSCPLGSRTLASTSAIVESEDFKKELQH